MVMNEQKQEFIWASLGTTVRTGDFENIKLDIGISGIPVGASKEYIDAKMTEANATLHEVIERLSQELIGRVAELREAVR